MNTQAIEKFNKAIEAIRTANSNEELRDITKPIFDKENITTYSLYHLELIQLAIKLKMGYIKHEAEFQKKINGIS